MSEWLSRRLNKILGDRKAQFAEHIFPLSIIGETGWELPNWVQDYESYWKEKADEIDPDTEDEDEKDKRKQALSHAANAKTFGHPH